jgi:hypothetical protein
MVRVNDQGKTVRGRNIMGQRGFLRATVTDEGVSRLRLPWSRVPDPHDIARRYLSEGRLRVLFVDRAHVLARCEGQRGIYQVGYEPGRGWWCSCEWGAECHHQLALKLVTRSKPPFSSLSLRSPARRSDGPSPSDKGGEAPRADSVKTRVAAG